MDDTAYSEYMRELKNCTILSGEEQRKLAVRAQSGDSEARNMLVKSNLFLVVSIAKKACTPDVSIMDLIQEGNLGLMDAVSSYNPKFETKFSTYAYLWIFQYIMRFIRIRNPMIKIPFKKNEMLRTIEVAREQISAEKNREAYSSEISEYTGIDEDVVVQIEKLHYKISSFEAPITGDGKLTVGETLEDESLSPERIFFKEVEKGSVHSILNLLPEKERYVIYYRYNFECDEKPKTLREISSMLGVSAETVRLMEIRAMKKLRGYVESTELYCA